MEEITAGGGSSLLSQILLHNVSPVIVVLCTPLAEAACAKNNLSFVDLLHPFCILDRINVPVRTASETSYRLQQFRLRLFYTSQIRPTPIEAAEEQLLEVVTDASDLASNELKGDPQQLDVVQRMVQTESASSWFQKYSSAFCRTLAFSDHESFDHPVACLLVVSSADVNPLNAFADLSNRTTLPALFTDGVMDPRVLKHYVVLHDNQEGSPDRANEVLQNICSTFDVNDCSLIRINSSSACSPPSVYDFWSAHIKTAEGSEYGCCLGVNDIDEIQAFVLDFCQKHIIPYMEQKVRFLNQQVAATRRGLKNQIKNLWWRKKDSEVPEAPSVYTFNSMESQIRILADYAFMLRDYELAVSNYRLLSNDYKADKALKRYAGVMEMIGICLCLLDQSRKEADSSLETAYITYQICGSPHSRYATRTALWWSEVHKARAQFPEAAYVLFRAATEMDKEATLRAGVLLEQSAYCYLRCDPPMLRKYGFHLVLAGIRYHVSGQRKHALRAYRSVVSVYNGQGWNFINDHVNLHLARISLSLGQLNTAVQHFMKSLACSHQSASTQSLFLKEFLGAVQNLNTKDDMLRLCLPFISSENLYVRFEDHRTYASPSATSVPFHVWDSLEEGFVPSSTTPFSSWLEPYTGRQKQVLDFNVSVSGEDVLVFFQVRNPLQIAIDVSLMELICAFQPKSIASSNEAEPRSETNTSALVLSKESFSLRGGEKLEICLKVKPLEEGLLNIVGVKWMLCGVVYGRHDFPIQDPSQKSRSRKLKEDVPSHQRLKFHVLGHMPRLEISMHELPSRMNKGEIRRAVLEIQNSSTVSVKNIKLKTSHPGYLMVGEQGDLDLEFPKCLEERQDQIEHSGSIPPDVCLEGGSTLLWPLWLHAREDGELTLKTVVYFEASEAMSLKYRTVRMTHSVQVIPSLQISVRISSSPVKLDQYLVRMDVTNVHPSESFWLRQTSCIGEDWNFAPIQPQRLDQSAGNAAAFLSASISPSQLLPATQSSSYFFQLTRKRGSAEAHNNVRLGPPGSVEPVINMSSSPLSYFHEQEKHLQPKDFQGSASVDVVLVTGQQGDMTAAAPTNSQGSFRFATHHVCHCRTEDGYRPLVWALEGPKCVGHDFAKRSMCQVPVFIALRNASEWTAMVRIETSDSLCADKVGWRSTSPPPTLEGLATSSAARDSSDAAAVAAAGLSGRSAFIWSASKSVTALEIKAGASARAALSVTVFAPGIFDLCSYRLRWKLLIPEEEEAATSNSRSSRKKRSSSSKFVPAPATRSASSSAAFLGDDPDQEVFVVKNTSREGEETGQSYLLTVIHSTGSSGREF